MSYFEKMYESPIIGISCLTKGYYIEGELICFAWVDCGVKANLSLILLNNLSTNGVRVIGWWILWRKNVINWCMCFLFNWSIRVTPTLPCKLLTWITWFMYLLNDAKMVKGRLPPKRCRCWCEWGNSVVQQYFWDNV